MSVENFLEWKCLELLANNSKQPWVYSCMYDVCWASVLRKELPYVYSRLLARSFCIPSGVTFGEGLSYIYITILANLAHS
jgi:hypothetical protein